MNATGNRTSRQLPAVHGSVKLLQPIGSINADTGEVSINNKPYFCRCLEHGYQLFSFDSKKQQTTVYDLPADLSACDCADFLYRSDRREDCRCKHQKALAALIGKGQLPRLECNPIPHVPDLADADDGYLDDSEADAWHSQYDAA